MQDQLFGRINIESLHGGGNVFRAIRDEPGSALFRSVIGGLLLLIGGALLFGSVYNWITFFGGSTSGNAAASVQVLGNLVAGIGLGIMGAIVFSLGIYIFVSYFRGQFETQRMQEFAKKNGFRFIGASSGARYQARVFLPSADSRRHLNVVTGSIGDHKVEFGDFKATVESRGRNRRKSQHTVSEFAYVAINLGARAPKLVLDAQRDGRRININGMVRYELEGDFPSHFTTWVPADTERDMLEFMTPDVMQVFSDYGQDHDFELLGTLLVIIANKNRIGRVPTMAGLLQTADHLIPVLRHKATQGSW
ncbi:MAG: hypothetical protein ACTHXA_13810 [Gulosibacter sp.]|uniref:hypothetical protein n=1 Tax=Gulosibacter sp. TaxID=2817531 RepID=UPI003F8FFDEA